MNRRDFIKSATVLLPVPMLTRNNDYEKLRALIRTAPYRLVCIHPSHADAVTSDLRSYGIVLHPSVPEHLVWSCEHMDPDDYALRISNEYTRRAEAPGSVLVAWRKVRSWK